MTEETNLLVKKDDVKIIKAIFKDNEDLLKAMRAVMLDIKPTESEKSNVKTAFANTELYRVISERFYPTLEASKDAPIGQIQDVWLGAETMVFAQHRDTVQQAIGYKERAIKMLTLGLALLLNPDGEKPRTKFVPSEVVNDPLAIELQTRNMYIKLIDTQLMHLWIIAEQASDDKKEENKKKNSTQ